MTSSEVGTAQPCKGPLTTRGKSCGACWRGDACGRPGQS
jgi:hypothetical protein